MKRMFSAIMSVVFAFFVSGCAVNGGRYTLMPYQEKDAKGNLIPEVRSTAVVLMDMPGVIKLTLNKWGSTIGGDVNSNQVCEEGVLTLINYVQAKFDVMPLQKNCTGEFSKWTTVTGVALPALINGAFTLGSAFALRPPRINQNIAGGGDTSVGVNQNQGQGQNQHQGQGQEMNSPWKK